MEGLGWAAFAERAPAGGVPVSPGPGPAPPGHWETEPARAGMCWGGLHPCPSPGLAFGDGDSGKDGLLLPSRPEDWMGNPSIPQDYQAFN